MTPKKRATIRAMFGGKCAYCGVDLPEKGWHADHVDPVVRKYKRVQVDNDPRRSWRLVPTGEFWAPENHREDNYSPSCSKCNIDKGACNLETYRRVVENKVKTLQDNSSAFRHAERYGMVVVVKEQIVFYFETPESAQQIPEDFTQKPHLT